MKISTRTTRRLSALALVVAAVVAPGAQAGHPDGPDGYQPQLHLGTQAIPDAVDRYLRNNSPERIPDAFDRFLGNHPDGYQPQLELGEQRIPDAFDRYVRNVLEPKTQVGRSDGPDGYQPQLRLGGQAPAVDRFARDNPDGFQPRLHLPISVAAPVSVKDGIDWTDAGIGAGIAFAFVLLASGAALAARNRGRVAHS